MLQSSFTPDPASAMLNDPAEYFKRWGTENTKSNAIQKRSWEMFEAEENPVVRCEFHDPEDSPIIDSALTFTTAATLLAGFAIADFGSSSVDDWTTPTSITNATDSGSQWPTNATDENVHSEHHHAAVGAIYMTMMAFV
eukprot:COSAG02_NODE_12089_length_1599_cov_2.757333_1_plen_139_part_00